jgi:hypothetical protein
MQKLSAGKFHGVLLGDTKAIPIPPASERCRDFRLWHEAADRCGAKVQTLSEVKRTLWARRERVDLTKMTDSVEKVSEKELWN